MVGSIVKITGIIKYTIASSFLGFPTWYEFLPKNPNDGSPRISSISDIWLILLAAIDILLRLAAILAVFVIIYAGFEFITSQGDPEKAKKARGTIINALIGLVISVTAATIVVFIAGVFR